MLETILKYIGVFQTRKIPYGNPELGFRTEERINPFNPLSYLFILIGLVIGLLMYGFVGMWEKITLKKAFRWG